ncbi:unnamed protein product [Mytilus edulis]|uniref:C2H2-type domain-containing protein n=1 Tax=Mytilus edulis TaxID=6550 RepID=A0A8S3SGI4_MYTED|nr:unnamed protein product [Mytilus edulis]
MCSKSHILSISRHYKDVTQNFYHVDVVLTKQPLTDLSYCFEKESLDIVKHLIMECHVLLTERNVMFYKIVDELPIQKSVDIFNLDDDDLLEVLLGAVNDIVYDLDPILKNINPNKATGQYLIPCRVMKETAEQIAPYLEAIDKSMKNVRYRIKVVDNMTAKPKSVDRVIPSISSYSNFTFERNGIRVWKAYNIGQGCLISNITSVESIQLQVIEDSGHIHFHQLKQKMNIPETDSEDVVVCSTEGCTKTFATNEELTNHLYSEKCTLVFDQKSSCSSDISKVKYLEKVAESSVNKQLMIMPSATKLSTSDSELDMGWALKDERKNKRFNKNQTDYLHEKFNKGQKVVEKEDPYSVSEAMLLEKNEDGSRRFHYSEILSVQQITSYFSRLCRKLKLDESGSDAAREETISNLTQQINSDN